MSHTARILLRRMAATGVSISLLLLGPAAWPAWADSASGDAGPNATAAAWQPPPVGDTPLPEDPGSAGRPDNTFGSGQNGCIQSGVGATVIKDQPPAQSMLDLKDAQQISKGDGVTVAVIDTGVNPHPFLRGRLENGGDYILGDGNALQDCDGHGTIVSGIVGADTSGADPQVAFTGVAPDAKILAIKQTSSVYQTQNGTKAGDIGTLAQAIVHAADTPGVRVITMSIDDCLKASQAGFLGAQSFQQLHRALDYAVNEKDEVVVAAAGNLPSNNDKGTDQNAQQQSNCQGIGQNSNPNPNDVNQIQVPPVYTDDVLSVGSVDPKTGNVSDFSVWGPWVSVAAPGEDITSLDPGQNATGLSNRTVEQGQNVGLQGTSFAAPYVAGLAALIRSHFPNMSARQVMYRIEATAQHPSGPGGRNDQVGYGLIDPVAALTAILPGQNGVPMTGSTSIPALLNGNDAKSWQPFQVAVIGTGAGAALLLITLFVVRTVRHNRDRQGMPVRNP